MFLINVLHCFQVNMVYLNFFTNYFVLGGMIIIILCTSVNACNSVFSVILHFAEKLFDNIKEWFTLNRHSQRPSPDTVFFDPIKMNVFYSSAFIGIHTLLILIGYYKFLLSSTHQSTHRRFRLQSGFSSAIFVIAFNKSSLYVVLKTVRFV